MDNTIERIKQSVKKHSYHIVHGINNHDEGMTVQGFYQVINEELAKEPQECNSDLISKKKLIEDIETLKNQIHILTKNIRGLVPTKCDNVSAINEKCNNIMTEIYAFQIGYNQPQVQPIVRTPEEVAEMLNKISCTDCDRHFSHCRFNKSECKNYWFEWLTKKEV